jgi:hypothetical protein
VKKTISLLFGAILCCFLLSSAAADNLLMLMIKLKSSAAHPPSVSLSADPLTINSGQSSTLTWTSKNAATVSIDNGIGEVAASGSQSVELTATTTYTITAVGAKETVTDSVTITVVQPPLPTVSLSADPTSIIEGDSTTLTWTSENADSVSIDNGIGEVAASGTESVSPTETTTYNPSCDL